MGRAPFDEFVALALLGDDDRAHEEVGVSTDVLRGGVDDGTRTQRERLLQHGRGEGVVDDGRDAGVAGRSQYRRQVGDAEQRIGRGLEPQQVGAVHRVEHLLGIHHVDGARTQSSLFLQTFEETPCPVVAVGRKDDRGSERP